MNKKVKIQIDDIPIVERKSLKISNNLISNESLMNLLNDSNSLKVYALGAPANIAILSPDHNSYGDDKILIAWKSKWPNPIFTKYFSFEEPGILEWGQDWKVPIEFRDISDN